MRRGFDRNMGRFEKERGDRKTISREKKSRGGRGTRGRWLLRNELPKGHKAGRKMKKGGGIANRKWWPKTD